VVEPGVQCGAVETGPGSLGAHGMQPWGDVLLAASATGPGSLTVSREFKVELLSGQRRRARDRGFAWRSMSAVGLTISPEG